MTCLIAYFMYPGLAHQLHSDGTIQSECVHKWNWHHGLRLLLLIKWWVGIMWHYAWATALLVATEFIVPRYGSKYLTAAEASQLSHSHWDTYDYTSSWIALIKITGYILHLNYWGHARSSTMNEWWKTFLFFSESFMFFFLCCCFCCCCCSRW